MKKDDDFNRGVFQGKVMTELRLIRSTFEEHVQEDRRTATRLEEGLERLTKEVTSFRDWRNKVVAIWGTIGALSGTMLGVLFNFFKR